jgi:hypothetical protein
MATNHITKPLTVDDLFEIQKQIELYRHLMASARAGHYMIHANPGQENGFLVTNVPHETHGVIAKTFLERAERIRAELLAVYNVAIDKDV